MLKFGVKCGLWQEPTEVMVRVDISCLVLLKVTGPFWGGAHVPPRFQALKYK